MLKRTPTRHECQSEGCFNDGAVVACVTLVESGETKIALLCKLHYLPIVKWPYALCRNAELLSPRDVLPQTRT